MWQVFFYLFNKTKIFENGSNHVPEGKGKVQFKICLVKLKFVFKFFENKRKTTVKKTVNHIEKNNQCFFNFKYGFSLFVFPQCFNYYSCPQHKLGQAIANSISQSWVNTIIKI